MAGSTCLMVRALRHGMQQNRGLGREAAKDREFSMNLYPMYKQVLLKLWDRLARNLYVAVPLLQPMIHRHVHAPIGLPPFGQVLGHQQ